jgi:hypothetical protein
MIESHFMNEIFSEKFIIIKSELYLFETISNEQARMDYYFDRLYCMFTSWSNSTSVCSSAYNAN